MNETLQITMSDGCAMLFLIVFLEQVGLPIPGAPWLLAAGALCVAGEANPLTVIGATVLACLIADSAWFYFGRLSGKRVAHFLGRFPLLRNSSLEEAERNFARHGMAVVVVAKFVPGLSLAAPPLAGAFGVATGRFLLFDLFGAVCYAAFYLGLGEMFSNQVQAILAILNQLGLGSLLLVLVIILAHLAFARRSQRKTQLPTAASFQ